jgi:molybdenum cofactor cytidylyltransferase
MQLFDALRLGESRGRRAISSVAFVGAGGKTAALFRLATENPAPTTILTTTTHIAVPQAGRADAHFIVGTPGEVDRALAVAPQGVLLFTGPVIGEGKLAGLEGPALDRLHQVARERGWLLLIEADGSRKRPLKAPATHEPALPAWIEMVVVVVGLSGLGQPLEAAWVHRPERFAALSRLAQGGPVTLEGLQHVLLSPEGGLKEIPPAARRVLMLNQADDPQRQAQAAGLAEACLGAYSQVLVTSLEPDRRPGPVAAAHERVAGIILAAGASTRLGTPKQLLEWHGRPLVVLAVETALQARLQPVVVVTGANAPAVRQAVEAGLERLVVSGSSPGVVQIVENPDWRAGQSSSVQAGLRELPDDCGAAVFLLCDQPLVSPALVRSLVSMHAESLAPIVAPLVDGQRGNPVLFDRRTFPEFSDLSGDTGGRALFSRYPVTWLPWHDRSVLADIDTLDDYLHLQELKP